MSQGQIPPTETTAPAQHEQFAARLDELQRRSDALTVAFARARQTRQIIMFAFLAFVVVAGWSFYSLGNSVRSKEYQDRLLTELQKSVADNQDTFSSEAQKLVDAITPVVTTAFVDQSQKDLPLFMQAFDKEREDLMDSLPKRMSEHVEQHYHGMVSQHEKLLDAEFPAAKNPEVRDRMIANVQDALDRLVKKYYVEEFQREFKLMSAAWNDFPAADVPGEGEPPLTELLKGEIVELLAAVARYRHVEPESPPR